MSTISVVIPVKDRTEEILLCLDSVRRSIKDYVSSDPKGSVEILVVDDHSRIPLTDVINGSFGDVRVERLPETSGPAIARNHGLRNTEGDIIAFTDSDCLVDSNWLKTIDDSLVGTNYGGVQGVPWAVASPHLWVAANEEILARYIWESNYIEEGIVRLIDTKNLSLMRDFVRERYEGYRVFPERIRIASNEDRIAGKEMTKEGGISWNPDMIVYHMNPRSFPGLLRQKYRHGMGAYHYYQGDLRFLERLPRHFIEPIKSGVSLLYILPAHSAFWIGCYSEKIRKTQG
jgi:glycosyltransferase involved in cell wall biosynthesis|tara:strand:- start:33 stop:896 length:864 start_codon:yes stop_codon:yes gene_type:complete